MNRLAAGKSGLRPLREAIPVNKIKTCVVLIIIGLFMIVMKRSEAQR